MQSNLHITLTPFINESRVLKETSSLVRRGLVKHVYIVALYEEGLKELEDIDTCRTVWRVRLRARKWPRSLWVQLIKYIEFCVKVFLFSRAKDVDLVNIHHLDLLPLGLFLKWACGSKLVFDAHELETERHGLRGFRQVIARHVERLFIKYVDLVIVVSDGINDWYRNKYGLLSIVTVLNCPELQEPQGTRLLHHELSIPEEKKIVIYQGGLSSGRGVEQLLKEFAEHDDNKHALVLMGDGELEPLVKEYAEAYSNIYFQASVAPTVVLKYTASADVGISFIENTNLSYYWCLPNKLFEYIMSGLPVIVSNLPEMRRIVNENHVGVVLDELSYTSLSRALDEIANIDADTLKDNLKRAASTYSWQNQERVMMNAYREYVV